MKNLILKILFFCKHPMLVLERKIKIVKYVNIKKVSIKVFNHGHIEIGSASFRDNGMIRVSNNAQIIIGNNVFFNSNINVTCLKKIAIGDNSKVGCNVCILDHDHDYKNDINEFLTDEVVIGKNVWIGANSVICKGVHIGDNSVIAAGSIVTKSIPRNTILIQKKISIMKKIGD